MTNDVVNSTTISYINIDSSSRTKLPKNIYSDFINLPNYPLLFTNNSSNIIVTLEDNPFKINDLIILNNIVSKNVQLVNSLMIKKNSLYARITHKNHGLTLYGLYDESNSDEFTAVNYVDTLPGTFDEQANIPDGVTKYYILNKNENLNFKINLSSIKGNDISRSLIGNVQTNYLNTEHVVYLLFTKQNTTYIPDRNNYLIKLKKKASINYFDGVSFLKDNNNNATSYVATNLFTVKFLTLFGIPLNYLNGGDQTSITTIKPYFTIIDTSENSFTIDVGCNAIVEPNNNFYNYTDTLDNNVISILNQPNGGGIQCIVVKVSSTESGYPNPNQYVVKLEKTFANVSEVELVSSIFPNSQKTINNVTFDIVNNKLYWRNLSSGDYIYKLEIVPGNYSLPELESAIEKAFSDTLRYEYTAEFQNGIFPSIIENSTPLIAYSDGFQKYDDNGYYKYHIVDVSISEITDVVTFTTYREIIQTEKYGGDSVLIIPDYYIQFTNWQNLQVDFSTIVNSSGNLQQIIPFDPTKEDLYIYFTKNSHLNIETTFPYSYNNLYKYVDLVSPYTSTSIGETTFLAELNQSRALLVNFYRSYGVYPNYVYTNEINSINTPTLLINFIFSLIDYKVQLSNHQLAVGDLLITDQFKDQVTPNNVYVYEVVSIIDADNFSVFRCPSGTRHKFIYDSLIINFNENNSGSSDLYYWLDNSFTGSANSLSFSEIVPTPENKKFIHVQHPNHQLEVGDYVTLNYSGPVNQVPQDAINTMHQINRIIDDNHYEISLDKYIPLSSSYYLTTLNTITIQYPDKFQMFFSYNDTLGNILSFYKPGDSRSITDYKHVISNTDNYLVDYNYNSLGIEYGRKLKKLKTTGYDYFYIVSKELGYFYGTKPVENVFAKILWNKVQNGISIDSFAKTKKVFDVALSSLSEISFSFCHPNGNLIEFNDIDHSFVLKITELSNKLYDTSINTRITSKVHV